jgi:hypothetical protein
MNIEQLQLRLSQIEAVRGDDERAHVMADALLFEVLREIAAGTCDAQQLAAEAIKVSAIKFQRRCA